jgi:hypothetical protein
MMKIFSSLDSNLTGTLGSLFTMRHQVKGQPGLFPQELHATRRRPRVEEKSLEKLHENTSEAIESMEFDCGVNGHTLPRGPNPYWQRHLSTLKKI